MAKSNEEWELSKENIQPIQQGRKQNVLKVALAPHPEDLILKQKQEFEHELRIYTGDDPLFVWCKYIKWVEQNFPKGGKDGHIKQLIEQCLSVLKDKKKYYDDERFIDIFLKFANIGTKPLEVYNYMFSQNIGCKSAKFFINWSWELEQLGNFKKADDILIEGIQRKAEPFEKLKSYYGEFQVRLINKLKQESETNNENENCRSAFTVLKPVKKNVAPVMRIGEAVENKKPLILGRQPTQIKSNSVKIPFKIYNSENVSSLPIQSKSVHPPILSSEIYKENEMKPSKWNKVKVKSVNQYLKISNGVDVGFKFHCDEENEDRTPKTAHKTSNALSVRKKTQSPLMALFEPPDPLKKPMYDKNKVYGGAEEYSLEEIRAATWFEEQKRIKQERLLAEQQKTIEQQAKDAEKMKKVIEHLTQKVQLFQSNFSGNETDQCKTKLFETNDVSVGNFGIISNRINQKFDNFKENEFPETHFNAALYPNTSQNSSESSMKCLPKKEIKANSNITDNIDSDCTDYRVAVKMVQDLYNGTLTHSTEDIDYKQNSSSNFENFKKFSSDNTVTKTVAIENGTSCASRNGLPFTLFYDSTETNSHLNFKAANDNLNSGNNEASQNSLSSNKNVKTSKINQKDYGVQSSTPHDSKINIPFPLFYDPTEMISSLPETNLKSIPICNNESSSKNVVMNKSLKATEQDFCEEDVENIPPKGYIQEKTKRELSGVLVPSKNILYIPLEEQENSDDSVSEEEYVCNNQPADQTLIPPTNTEQFKTDKFLASTPCASKITNNNNNNNNNNTILKNHSIIQDTYKMPEKENLAKNISSSRVTQKLPNMLSVIMERSSENYSKSSSSSSSNSVNSTKSGHLDSFLNHGSVQKHLQKLDICEINPLSTVPEVSDSADSCDPNVPCNNITNFSIVNENHVYTEDYDPFDLTVNENFLKLVKTDEWKHLFKVSKSMRCIKIGENLNVGDSIYRIENLIAEGAYAKVYKATLLNFINSCSAQKVALKVCKHANEWEFYICNEIQKRLSLRHSLPDAKNSFMNIFAAIKFSDGIVLVNEYCDSGTLLDVVNFYKKQNSSIPELIVMYFTLEILQLVSKLHACNIIHGDIKPDNFLIMDNAFDCDVINHFSEYLSSVRLIDFGRAIDLNFYRKGVCFTKTLTAAHFKCNEMKENKPWVFQLDWYGVLSCVHTMLFSEYMTVKKIDEKWKIQKRFPRYWYTSLWESLFDDFLNIPSCYKEPDVGKYVSMIESRLKQNCRSFANNLTRLSSYLRKK